MSDSESSESDMLPCESAAERAALDGLCSLRDEKGGHTMSFITLRRGRWRLLGAASTAPPTSCGSCGHRDLGWGTGGDDSRRRSGCS